jgi:hypothetical protein
MFIAVYTMSINAQVIKELLPESSSQFTHFYSSEESKNPKKKWIYGISKGLMI